MSEIRQQGYVGFECIYYAVLEKDGKLTVLPRAKYAPPTQETLGISTKEEHLMHIVYNSGQFNDVGLSLIEKDRAWLKKQLSRRGVVLDDQFCVTANSNGDVFWIPNRKGDVK